jgi:hypothetical protein
MRRILTLFLSGVVLSTTSCNKEIEFIPLAMPTPKEEVAGNFEPFNVTISNDTYKKGEQVRFYFTGETESIDFYSGEFLRQYEYKDSRIIDGAFNNPTISFNTLINPAPILKNFHFLVSNDYNPGPTPAYSDITNSTWTAIDFPISTIGNKWTASGTLDLSNYVVKGKPLYFAFKYVNSFNPTSPSVHLAYYWYVQAISFKNKVTNDKSVELSNQTNSGFVEIQQNMTTKGSYTWLADRFMLLGNRNAPAGTEHWVVSKAIYPMPVETGGDKPVPIKSPGGTKLISYTQVYSESGVYKAYFIVKQKNLDGTFSNMIKIVNVTVTD